VQPRPPARSVALCLALAAWVLAPARPAAAQRRVPTGASQPAAAPGRAAVPGRAAPPPAVRGAAPAPRRAASSQPPRRKVVDPTEPARRRQLQARLEGILQGKGLRRVQVGVQVVDPDGEVLFAHEADRLLKAASNTKIFTSGAALALLGGGFQLRTMVLGQAPDEQGVVRGDLYLRGAGDPYLSSANLLRMAKRLHERGVRRVTGAIVADESREGNEPGRGTGGLSLDRSTFRVVVSPGPRVKARPHAAVAPGLSRYFKIVNRAVTVRRGKLRLTVTTRDVGAQTVVTVAGRIPLGHRAVSISRNPRHSSLFVGHSLRAMLDSQGISVAGGVRAGRAPKDRELPVLAESFSPTLAAMARPVNKDSNNFMAERVFQATGAELYGGPATSAKGSRAVAEGLKKLGLEPGPARWNQVDGSGLSHSNRMTPAFVAEVLRRLLRGDPQVYADFFQSLAVGGKDGTIRGRFRVGPDGGIVFGKTGTLRDTSCLSGYVRANGKSLVFAILMNGTRRRTVKLARQAQNEMVMAVYRYLAGDAAAVALPEPQPGDVEREEPGPDETVFDESREITDEGAAAPSWRLPAPEGPHPPPLQPRLAPWPPLRAPLLERLGPPPAP
jgi:D-alanyl-D-alanine carboxypeptidase/D-alanyl-D-alanine-endopeptidase (penicillin-binding protein 4)